MNENAEKNLGIPSDELRPTIAVKAEFTPGPWRVEPIFGDDDLSIVIDYVIPGGGSPLMVGHAVGKDEFGLCPATQDEAVANARLMAAAPDLYEALRELMRWGVEFDDERMDYITVQVDRGAIQDACNALAFATTQPTSE